MSQWENSKGGSDEWYTPKYIFDALDVRFDMDVSAPEDRTHCHVPADQFITQASEHTPWQGFLWMNPPFGGRNGIVPWLHRIHLHRNGIALAPDRTSAPWWQKTMRQADAVLFLAKKVKFIRPDGSTGDQPGGGTVLFAYGERALIALQNAERNGLGLMLHRYNR